MNSPIDSKLAAPGAGLPLPELLIARLRFKIARWRLDREAIATWFDSEANKIRKLVDELPSKQGGTPVLIKRLRGMEDSSRCWSVYMTLDHLQIVNHGIAEIIKQLASPNEPALPHIGTADVKPDPTCGDQSLHDFEHSVSQVQTQVTQIDNLKTQWRHPHPWFGQLDAHGFYTLLAMHMGIHRKQIERILSSLRD